VKLFDDTGHRGNLPFEAQFTPAPGIRQSIHNKNGVQGKMIEKILKIEMMIIYLIFKKIK